MKHWLVIFCVVFILPISGQTIDFSGHVSDQNGVPIPGAIVELLIAHLRDTTESNGLFVFKGATTNVLDQSQSQNITNESNERRIAIPNGLHYPIEARLYDCNGRKLAQSCKAAFRYGTYMLTFNDLGVTYPLNKVYVLKLKIGSAPFVTKTFIPQSKMVHLVIKEENGTAISAQGKISVKTVTPADTIICSAAGYLTKKTIIWDYRNTVDIVLYPDNQSVPTAPVIRQFTMPLATAKPTWTWHSDLGAGVIYRYRCDNSDLTSNTTSTTDTFFSPGNALTEGVHTLYVQVANATGQWSMSASSQVVIDLTPPVFTLDTPLTHDTVITYTSYIDFIGSLADINGIQKVLWKTGPLVIDSGAVTNINVMQTRWAISKVLFFNGGVCTFTAFDNTGVNKTSITFTANFSIDTIAPSPATAPAGMVLVKGGYGRYGSDPGNKTILTSFYMDINEVTNQQFWDVCGYGPTPTVISTNPDYPVIFRTWYDAILYCNALSKKNGLDTVYTYDSLKARKRTDSTVMYYSSPFVGINYGKNGYRLPTEAEWEHACRAGSTTQYFWGETYNNSYCPDYGPVGSGLPNPRGLYGMTGNAFEMVNDCYMPTWLSAGMVNPPYAAVIDPYHNILINPVGPYPNMTYLLPNRAAYATTVYTMYKGGGYGGNSYFLINLTAATVWRHYSSTTLTNEKWGFRTVLPYTH